MQRCGFCGTLNDPSQVRCLTCDSELQPQQSGGQTGGSPNSPYSQHLADQTNGHTLNTRPLTPGISAAGLPPGPYGVPGQSHAPTARLEKDETAAFGAIHPSQAPLPSNKTELTQRSPHDNTQRYAVPDDVAQYNTSSPSTPAPSPSPPASSAGLEAFESAPSAPPPIDQGYQVDFGGFSEVKGVSSRLQTMIVFFGLLALGLLGFVGYMIFAGDGDDESKMAAKRKGPNLSTPLGRAKHNLKQASVHIGQQRWELAQTSLKSVLDDAPNQELRDQANTLLAKLKLEKAGEAWFRYALERDKKGKWSQAHAALQKIDPKTRLSTKARLLEKRIYNTRLANAMKQSWRLYRRRRYKSAYVMLLRVEQVDPKYKKLKRTKSRVLRKLKRDLRKRSYKCRRYCRRRYRRRRHRKRKQACYDRCRTRYALPQPEKVELPSKTAVVPNTQADKRDIPKPPKRRMTCKEKCLAFKTSYDTNKKKCIDRKIARCKRYYKRKFRRSRRRRNYYIRKRCRSRRYRRICSRWRPARRAYLKWRRCRRRCR